MIEKKRIPGRTLFAPFSWPAWPTRTNQITSLVSKLILFSGRKEGLVNLVVEAVA